MVIHVPPAMLPTWGLTSDPEAAPAKTNQLHQAEEKCKHLKCLIQDETQWSESCLPPFISFLQINHVAHPFPPTSLPHLQLPPGRPLGFGEPRYSLSFLSSSRIKDDKPHVYSFISQRNVFADFWAPSQNSDCPQNKSVSGSCPGISCWNL